MVQVLKYTTIKKILIDRNFQFSYRNFANKYLSDVVWTILKQSFFPLLGLSINWNTMYTLSIPEKHIIKCWKFYIPKYNHAFYTLFANVCVAAYFLRFQRFNSDTSLTYRTKTVLFLYWTHLFLSGCRSPKPLTQTLVITRI